MKARKSIPWKKRWQVFQLSEGRCHICGQPIEFSQMTVDHVIPLSGGGTDATENLKAAHSICNRKKGGAKPMRKQGLSPSPCVLDAAALATFLREQGLNQTAASEMLKMDRCTLNRVLRGKQNVSYEFMGRFVQTFGAHVASQVFCQDPAEPAEVPA